MEMIRAHLFMGGPVVYPLLLCSVLVLALWVERLWVMLGYPALRCGQARHWFMSQDPVARTEAPEPRTGLGLGVGVRLLWAARHHPKAVREDMLSLWLQRQRAHLLARTRWLALLGAVAPLTWATS